MSRTVKESLTVARLVILTRWRDALLPLLPRPPYTGASHQLETSLSAAWVVWTPQPDRLGVVVFAQDKDHALLDGAVEMGYDPETDDMHGFDVDRAPSADDCDPREPIPLDIMRLCGFIGDDAMLSCDTCGLANPTSEHHKLWDVCEHCNQCGECGCDCPPDAVDG